MNIIRSLGSRLTPDRIEQRKKEIEQRKAKTPMFTVLVIYQVNLATMFYTRQFNTHEEAQEFRTAEVEWNEDSHLYKGALSDDEAIAEYLD